MEPIIVTKGLCRDFVSGQEIVHAVRDVSLEIPANKLTILRGRSGSGKTTMINLLGALDHPTSGEIFFQGEEIAQASETHRDQLRQTDIGFIFQSVALISTMSAYENVEFGLRVAGIPAKDRLRRAQECLEMVGLGKRMRHYTQELSGGEQQRVAIARAIAHRPQVIFADEPTAALDTAMGLQVVSTFRQLIEQENITIVMTTHDPKMMEIADVVYTLSDGGLIDDESAEH